MIDPILDNNLSLSLVPLHGCGSQRYPVLFVVRRGRLAFPFSFREFFGRIFRLFFFFHNCWSRQRKACKFAQNWFTARILIFQCSYQVRRIPRCFLLKIYRRGQFSCRFLGENSENCACRTIVVLKAISCANVARRGSPRSFLCQEKECKRHAIMRAEKRDTMLVSSKPY